jgi:hypothetical protein
MSDYNSGPCIGGPYDGYRHSARGSAFQVTITARYDEPVGVTEYTTHLYCWNAEKKVWEHQ